MSLLPERLLPVLAQSGAATLCGAPEGYDALLLADLVRGTGTLLHVARDDARLAQLAEQAAFFAPEAEVLAVPAWDCLPYDRVSPNVSIVSRRIESLSRLAESPVAPSGGRLVLTTVNALLQRLPHPKLFAQARFQAEKGGTIDMARLQDFLERNGYARAETVMEPGEYALRGGIVDIFPPGELEPLRLDLFGDAVESIRRFDPATQRSTTESGALTLYPMSEVLLDPESVARFRTGYRAAFGAITDEDPLYESVSAGRKFAGMEHWLPLFHEEMESLFAYLPDKTPVSLDHQAEEARNARLEQIQEYYDARCDFAAGRAAGALAAAEGTAIYRPLAPDRLYLTATDWDMALAARGVARLNPFTLPDAPEVLDAQGRAGHEFSAARTDPDRNVFDSVGEHLKILAGQGRRTAIAAFSEGSRTRLAAVMKEHGIANLEPCADFPALQALDKSQTGLIVLGLERGFSTPNLAILSEQDILGDRLVRTARKRRRADAFLTEAASLNESDLVVHVDHGIGRYDGLEAVEVAGAPHDCLRLIYDGGDKLYVPVENIEVLTRFGSEQAGVSLDRLGGAAWQARKARLKKRIRDMAEQLIAVAAQRQVKKGEPVQAPEGLYDEFCARFPYPETDDQLRAIADVFDDLGSGRPMDRLICGDVGFGKTEVALRAAFAAALSGAQVAVVVPTTLLARQHYRVFAERFAGLPVRVAQLSRLVAGKKASEVKADLAEGRVDIVVGTHALLAKSIGFKRLGLLIVDEEQHFGVAHKERLKQMRADVHVLTLTATPIPRTLQLALSGVREMSVIATPPVDRLAVRTFVLPFDPVVIREAILRERFRGGQTFYVCPRVADIEGVAEQIGKLVPEVKLAAAHGRLSPTQLEDVMTAFADGAYDILLSTNIIESGLDMPAVNTIIIHRADMFGLGQLYQLRGRVGRSKRRGYAYLTLPPQRMLSKAAERRLQVMQTLDTLGAGFTLASHDLDIRGAGNLLGEEQSGHIREVGIELYQQLLEEAVAAARNDTDADLSAEQFSPQISAGASVLIPETYVADLGLRLSLYRRIAALSDRSELEPLAAELTDRFGALPEEVENLLKVVGLKIACRAAWIEKVDAGPKGAVLTFKDNRFPNPAGLVAFIQAQTGTVKMRPDHRLVAIRIWEEPEERLRGLEKLLGDLEKIAKAA